ncbi:UNVERIFIED_CONTAM: hypothetical protein FKN15_002070 [Acipenser sinensis]
MDGQEVTTGVRIGDRTERGDTDELKAMLVQLLHSQNELKSDIQTSTKAVQQICKVEIAETASQLRDEMEEGHRKIGEKLEGFEYKLQAVRNAAVGEQNLLKERIEQLERLPTTALSNPAAQQSPRTSLPAAASGSAQQKHKRLSSAVVLGGGEAKLLDEGILNTSLLESAGSCVIDVEMANSQMLVSTSLKKWIGSVTQIVQRKGLRLISEAEIGLAVIYMSTDTYCNPLSQTDTERSKTTIPGATLSQSMAVDETVMPAAMLNITTYAPDTETSQQYTR